MEKDTHLTPTQIMVALDGYIIGQKEAKRQVAIALRNRWRARHADPSIREEIIPNNILMIGSTGVGKTEIARRLAHLTQAPFIKVEASKFTEVGYMGRDVESMVRDLMDQSVRMVQKMQKETYHAEATEAVEEHILDILIPPIQAQKKQVHLAKDTAEDNINAGTRERFRVRLLAGELDDRKIHLHVSTTPHKPIGMIAGNMMDESSLLQLQDMIGGLVPKQQKKRKLSIADARKILLEKELEKRIDMDAVKEEAIKRTETTGIIFIDEMDKIVGHGGSEHPSVSKEGVQRDLLPIIEGSAVNTKYGVVHTDNILFIAAGAFHISKPSDLMPELQGRFPTRIELESLSEKDFLRILSEPHNALTKQYQALLKSEGVTLTFTKGALEKIAQIAYTLNNALENIGARRLHTVIGTLLAGPMFEIPDKMPPGNILKIEAKGVEKALHKLMENEDQARYLL